MSNCNTLGKGACVWVPTEDEYFLLQIHLHWGSDNTKGSEHQVCDNPRSAEMHMVFANTRGVAADRNDPDSGARFAVLGTVGEAGQGGVRCWREMGMHANWLAISISLPLVSQR